jgi:hypothetical protein
MALASLLMFGVASSSQGIAEGGLSGNTKCYKKNNIYFEEDKKVFPNIQCEREEDCNSLKVIVDGVGIQFFCNMTNDDIVVDKYTVGDNGRLQADEPENHIYSDADERG